MSRIDWTPIARVYEPLAAGSIDGTDEIPHDRAVVRAVEAKYKPNRCVKGDPRCTIFVSSLNHITDEQSLQMVFSQYGCIRTLRLVRDIVTGFSKGYAFIEYEERQYALKAEREANGIEVDDKKLFVDFECERTMPGWIPRRLGGGLGGKRESGQLRFGGKARPFRKPIIVPEMGNVVKTQSRMGAESATRKEKSRESEKRSSYYSRRNRSRSRSRDRARYHHHRSRSRSRERYGSHKRRRRSRSRSRSRDVRPQQRLNLFSSDKGNKQLSKVD